MSGGQRQAVAIARTRLSDAKIVLMDEPTAAISLRQVAEVLSLIRRPCEQGLAVVWSAIACRTCSRSPTASSS
jgi:simple sugar transport system ATP-binding protein